MLPVKSRRYYEITMILQYNFFVKSEGAIVLSFLIWAVVILRVR